MATIYNSDLSKEIQVAGKIQINRDTIPNQLAEKVVPVMECNPRLLKICNLIKSGTLTNGTTVTIFTTDSNKDTYITGCYLSMVKDATATTTLLTLATTIGGLPINFFRLIGLTLTAQNQSMALSFPIPIKLDRNVAVKIDSTTGVGNISAVGGIFGYTVED